MFIPCASRFSQNIISCITLDVAQLLSFLTFGILVGRTTSRILARSHMVVTVCFRIKACVADRYC